jgi:tetratricopeptide (TPR) repeat protein
MDEQRFAAYLNLIQQLLDCPNGGENDILNANRELVDADLLRVMEVVAADMAEKGNSNAGWLQNLAAQLANFIGNTATSQEYLSFLMEVLQATSDSEENPQVVYPILQQNIDKLNLKFAEILQEWATSKFTEVTSEQAASIAGDIGNLGTLIQQFTLGRQDWNLEIGIACYQSALIVYTREQFPQQWAMTQNNLGNAYSYRIYGKKAENIEQAIACYESALIIYTLEQFPQDWAMTQLNLGAAYFDRIQGEKIQNIEQAIACYESSLIVCTPEQFPQQWAMIQKGLGLIYRDRIQGEKAQNIERSLACFESALRVYTREQFPQQWAMIQNNLGKGYRERIQGEKAQNIEQAIACFKSALRVYTLEQFPQDWAMTQRNLGIAYGERLYGEKAQNVEEEIACYESALIVFTPEQFPQDWATIQYTLGIAYGERLYGEKAQNVEEEIACYESALIVYKREQFPQHWAMTQNNMGSAYYDRIQGEKAQNVEQAIACFKSALIVFTPEQFPQDWARTQDNLGKAYRNRIRGEKAQNIELAIACYQSALIVHTLEQFPKKWAGTQDNLGLAYTNRIQGEKAENIERAIAYYQAALIVHTIEGFPQQWALTQNNLGGAYGERIQGEKAQNIEQAIACFESASIVYTLEQFPQDWAMTQHNLGASYYKIKGENAENIERAIAYFESALKVFTLEQFPQRWATTQNGLGNAYIYRIQGEKAQNIERAIACYQSALIVLTPTAFPLECLSTSRNLGYTAFTAGFWEIAIEGYEQAMTAVEQSRSWVTSDDRRQKMVAESIDVYENAMQACINSGKLEKAIEYCDRTRSKHLVDLMHSNDVYASGKIPPEVEKYLREFEAKQGEIDAEVEQLRNPSPGNKELATAGSQSLNRADFAAYTNKIEQLESEKQHIWQNIRRLDPVLSGQLQVDGMKFEAMQQLINNSQTAIICFYTTDYDTHVFVIYKDKSPQIHTCQGEGLETFQQWIRESWLLPYLVAKKSWKRGMGDFLSQLSQRLKVNELIDKYLNGIEELIVLPHRFLHQIPLAALPINPPQPPLAKGGLREGQDFSLVEGQLQHENAPLLSKQESLQSPPLSKQESLQSPPLSKGGSGGVLSDYFLIRYVPSCKILEYCHQRPTIESPQYGIVENATDDLYFTPFECEEITKIVPIEQHLKGRQQATVANYRDLVKQVNVLHSSHHAKSRLDNPLESELLLGDGTIRLGELMTPGWRLPELSDVFLSCCETNLGQTTITDDLLTLGTGFLCAGARSVVSTLWAVNDLATSLFSIFYYQFRQASCSRPDALRRAQMRLRTISGAELEALYKPQIDAIFLKINQNLNLTKGLYAQSNPFADLAYWSGFICQGLH